MEKSDSLTLFEIFQCFQKKVYDGKDRPQLPGDWGFREAGGRWGGEGENIAEGEEAGSTWIKSKAQSSTQSCRVKVLGFHPLDHFFVILFPKKSDNQVLIPNTASQRNSSVSFGRDKQ